MNLSALRRTAAEILAAAVFETFPQIELLGGGEDSVGFFYDFYFPHPTHPELLVSIEEKMRQIIREMRPVKTLEMVPFSAKELLKKEGHLHRLEDWEEWEGLVELIQIHSFTDLCPGPHLKNTAEAGAFKLLTIESLGDGQIRIEGVAHFSKKDLKELLKKLHTYAERKHQKIGEERGLWALLDEALIWRKKGLVVKEQLIQFLKERLFAGSEEVSCPPEMEIAAGHLALARTLGRWPVQVAEVGRGEGGSGECGLLDSSEETQIQIHFYSNSKQIEKGEISLLQSIRETFTILGFDYRLRLSGRKRTEKGLQRLSRALEILGWEAEIELQESEYSRVEFLVEDGLGREWPVGQIGSVFEREPLLEGCSIIISVEKILALLLEMNLKAWPFGPAAG